MHRYRSIVMAVLAGLCAAGTVSAQQGTPVVVELFTSEGCSDCPPADELLNKMAEHSPAGVDVIPLAFHVTYWDQYGWKDPFSDMRYTNRQREYVSHFRISSGYTPQSVVDGRYQGVGNNPNQVFGMIRSAAAQPKPLTVEVSPEDGSLAITVHGTGGKSGRVLLAITEDGLSTDVRAGENRSRTLHHDAVVRSLEDIGKLRDGSFSRTVRPRVKRDWQRDKLHAVVLVQGDDDSILGAATTALVSPQTATK